MAFPFSRTINLALLAGCIASGAQAQTYTAPDTQIPTLVPGLTTPNLEEGTILFSADRLVYDETNQLVQAVGKVEVSDGQRILLADTITYDKANQKVKAKGNISLLEPTGDVIFADDIVLDDKLEKGFIEHVKMLMPDESRLAGRAATLNGPEKTLINGVFSPCKPCATDSKKPLVWQLKAAKVIHDEEEQQIYYYDAKLEFLGVPIAYTPYFSHPDPTVKRRNGFLNPSLQNSSSLGTGITTPYYYAFAPNQDVTITPTYYTKEGLLLQTQYNHLLERGDIELDGSIAFVDEREIEGDPEPSGNTVRGHLFTKGEFALDEYWRAGYDINFASDKTYLNRFNIPSEDVLRSTLYTEGFEGRNYTKIEANRFQGLRTVDDSDTTPLILPEFEYSYVSEADTAGNRFDFSLSGSSLTRDQGSDSNRISLRSGWYLPKTTDSGHIFELNANLQGDFYHVNDVPGSNAGDPNQDGFVSRVFPQATASWRYPLVRPVNARISQLIEPTASVSVSPNGSNDDKIPNEDSLAFELDETNLFSANRFAGYDRVSSGKRIDYGVKTGFYDVKGRSINFFVGQSYSERENQDNLPTGSGAADQLSNIVGRVEVNPNKYLDLTYRFRLDPDGWQMQRNELGFSYNYEDEVGFNADYIFIDSLAGNGEFADREQISFNGYYKFDEEWYADAYSIYDLGEVEGAIRAGGGLTYIDDCFSVTLGMNRDFTRDIENEPDTTIFLKFGFKYLGTIATSSTGYIRDYEF